jgi:hypothetical protein
MKAIETVVALSIKQPWAWLIVNGHKDIENRYWSTEYRGRILIHTGQSEDKAGYKWVIKNFPELMLIPDLALMPRGGFVGSVEVSDCVTESKSPWFVGPFGFVLKNVKKLPFKKYPGKLGLFKVPRKIYKGEI